MPRLFRRALLLAALISLIAGLIVVGVRAAPTEYACLSLRDRDQARGWLLDVRNGAISPDRREYSFQTGRGAVSPDGTRSAYLNGSGPRGFTLYVGPRGGYVHGPSRCTGLSACWRSDRSEGVPVRTDMSFDASIFWTRESSHFVYAWADTQGLLHAAVAGRDGQELAYQQFGVPSNFVAALGWTGDGRYAVFPAYHGNEGFLLFWSPEDNRVERFAIRRESDPLFLDFELAPHGNRVAFIMDTYPPVLAIVSPDTQAEQQFTLPAMFNWVITWSPSGEHVALQYFDPPYWRLAIYGADGTVFRDVGGVIPSNNAIERDGMPPIFWSADGQVLALAREVGVDRFDLERFDLGTRNYAKLVRSLIRVPLASAVDGELVLARLVQDAIAVERVEPSSGAQSPLTAPVRELRRMRMRADGETVVYTAQRDEGWTVEQVNLRTSEITVLVPEATRVLLMEEARDSEHLRITWEAKAGPAEPGFRYEVFELDGTRRHSFAFAGAWDPLVPRRIALYDVNIAPDASRAVITTEPSEDRFRLQLAPALPADSPPDARRQTSTVGAEIAAGAVRLQWSPDSQAFAVYYNRAGTSIRTHASLAIYSRDGQPVREILDPPFFQELEWTRCD